MADRFDVVAVRVEDKGAVVVGMTVRPRARRPVFASPGRQGGPVKRVHRGAILGREGDVQGAGQGPAAADPEIRAAPGTIAEMGLTARLFRRYRQHQFDPQGRQGGVVKSLGARHVADGQTDMVQHGCLSFDQATYRAAEAKERSASPM